MICKIISYATTGRFTMQSLVMGKTVITHQERQSCQSFCSQRPPTWLSRPNLNIPWLERVSRDHPVPSQIPRLYLELGNS